MTSNLVSILVSFFRRLGLSTLVGIIAGFTAFVFLGSLIWATELRSEYPQIIWALPLAGALIAWMFEKFGGLAQHGSNLVIDEIHEPRNILPLRMAPLIFLGTILTHLFGGSAGREGTAVQMSASLGDQLSRWLKLNSESRRRLLLASTGAGFGAALGTPWAGALFGIEMIHRGRLQKDAFFDSLWASALGVAISRLLQTQHSRFMPLTSALHSLENLKGVVVVAILSGLAARVFLELSHSLQHQIENRIRLSWLRGAVAGALVLGFFILIGNFRYAGLGLPIIQESFLTASAWNDPLWKLALTALTLAGGFKGGEFVPLIFIGATLGSATSAWVGGSTTLLASVGFAATFGAAANTPLTCTVMAVELFGPQVAIWALAGCFIAYWISGQKSIYKSQKR